MTAAIEPRPTAALFGKGRVAVHALQLLLDLGYIVRYVVPTQPQPKIGADLVAKAKEHDLDILWINSLDELPEDHIDLGLSVYFDRIFRQRHINRFGQLLNVHNAPLPRNRGVLPVNWALRNSETSHGVTLHVIEEGIDVGPILSQRKFNINPLNDEVEDVYTRVLNNAQEMLTEALPQLEHLPRQTQDERLASYHHRSEFELLGDRKYWRREHTELIEQTREL